jgi:hypothetical protein
MMAFVSAATLCGLLGIICFSCPAARLIGFRTPAAALNLRAETERTGSFPTATNALLTGTETSALETLMFPPRTPAFLPGIINFPRGTQPCLFGTQPFQAGFADLGLKWLKTRRFSVAGKIQHLPLPSRHATYGCRFFVPKRQMEISQTHCVW